jgi:cytochrome c-type biogenesis protein CcmE
MSKKLDQELAEALDGHDEEPTSTPGVSKPAEPPKQAPRRSRNLGMLVTLLVMVAAVTTFFFVGLKPAAIYASPVDQLMASRDKFIGRKVRVEGDLVPGSLQKREQPCEYRFTIHGPKEKLPVRYAQCVIPDTFRDVPEGGVQVTVEGALTKEGTFEASLVMAKCASKYDPKEHKMKLDEPDKAAMR